MQNRYTKCTHGGVSVAPPPIQIFAGQVCPANSKICLARFCSNIFAQQILVFAQQIFALAQVFARQTANICPAIPAFAQQVYLLGFLPSNILLARGVFARQIAFFARQTDFARQFFVARYFFAVSLATSKNAQGFHRGFNDSEHLFPDRKICTWGDHQSSDGLRIDSHWYLQRFLGDTTF